MDAQQTVQGSAEAERHGQDPNTTDRLREELVHLIVHDMRSPLAVILANAELLGLDASELLSEESLADLDGIQKAARQLTAMTNDFIDVHRLEARSLVPDTGTCDVPALVTHAVQEMRTVYPGALIDVQLPEALLLTCDQDLVGRVLRHLLATGLEHAPRETPVRMDVTHLPGEVRMAVEHGGSQIPEECLNEIFEKPGAVKARRAGGFKVRGLCLVFCRHVVESHGGRIGVEHRPEGGNRFWFTLPDGSEESPRERHDASPPAGP